MTRLTDISHGAFGLALALALLVGGGAMLGEGATRATLERFAEAAAFGERPADANEVARLKADLGALPDGALLGASAYAHILAAERTTGAAAVTELDAARAKLIAQAQATPANPYLWAQLASVELALSARPERAATLLRRSFETGPNAVAAWPARVALGFRIWPAASTNLRAAVLAEAARMWRKTGDRNWRRPEMRRELVRIALAEGMTDVVAQAVAQTPADLAAWTNLVVEEIGPA